MTLKPPLVISSRLLPAIRVGKSFISLETEQTEQEDGEDSRGWPQYIPYFDLVLDDGTRLEAKEGPIAGPRGIREQFSALLDFLAAAVETYRNNLNWRKDEMAQKDPLFSHAVTEWAYQHETELEEISMELEPEE